MNPITTVPDTAALEALELNGDNRVSHKGVRKVAERSNGGAEDGQITRWAMEPLTSSLGNRGATPSTRQTLLRIALDPDAKPATVPRWPAGLDLTRLDLVRVQATRADHPRWVALLADAGGNHIRITAIMYINHPQSIDVSFRPTGGQMKSLRVSREMLSNLAWSLSSHINRVGRANLPGEPWHWESFLACLMWNPETRSVEDP